MNGKENGFGTQINSKGDKYEGEFVDGLKCGNGTLHYHNGDIYAGEFRNNLKNGRGTYTGDILNDRIVYESAVKVKQYVGGFNDDRECGYGEYLYSNGDKLILEEFQLANELEKITYQYSNGDIYKGGFIDYIKCGFGIITYNNGQKYVGDFRHDVFNGSGCLMMSKDKKVFGRFVNGIIANEGVFPENSAITGFSDKPVFYKVEISIKATICLAICEKKDVEISYINSSNKEITTRLSDIEIWNEYVRDDGFGIAFDSNNFTAYCHSSNQIENYHINRIKEVKLLPDIIKVKVEVYEYGITKIIYIDK